MSLGNPPRAELARAPATLREYNPCTTAFRKGEVSPGPPPSTQNHVGPEIETGIRNFQVEQDTAAPPGIKEINSCKPFLSAAPEEGEGRTQEGALAHPGIKEISSCNPFVGAAPEEGEGRTLEGPPPAQPKLKAPRPAWLGLIIITTKSTVRREQRRRERNLPHHC